MYIIMEIEIPDSNIHDLDQIRTSMGFTWPGFLLHLSRKADDLRELIRSKSKSEIISQNTLQTKLGIWAANIRDNLPTINESEDITTLPKINGPALCLAAGSSLGLHCMDIHKFRGVKIACERNLIPLLKKDIVPKYVVSIDGSEIMTHFIDHPLVDKYAHLMTGIFSTTAAPSTVNRWPGKKIFFNAWLDDINEDKSISMVLQEITRKGTMHTGGHCGATLWFLAYYLQASPIVMLGMDLAYPATIPDLSHTQLWDGVKHLPEKEILDHYRRETNPFGEEIITDYVFDGFKDVWLSWIKEMTEYETIQCSDYTILHQQPLKTMTFKEYLERGV